MESTAGRRRSTGFATLTAIAALALVVTSACTTEDGPADRATDPAATPVGPHDPPECPDAPSDDGTVPEAEIDRVDPEAAGEVPNGATSVRLCVGPGLAWSPPEDALVTDVDDVVALVNDLAIAEEPDEEDGRVCTADIGPGFRLAFDYPDGSRLVTSGTLYGCRILVVGSTERVDATEPWAEVVERLREQRLALDPDADLSDLADLSP